MSGPKTDADEPVELLPETGSEPAPVPGCAGCAELANVRQRAWAGGDTTTVAACNVFLRRHPEGH